jgi:hypothetical protein
MPGIGKNKRINAARDVVDAARVHGMAQDNYGSGSPEARSAERGLRQALNYAHSIGVTDDLIRQAENG